jgi:uncharacterized phage protein gp47/JayE
MATFPLATLAATVSDAGITAPLYSDIYTSLQASYRGIYGTDAYIDPDSQDGQLLAIVAKAISDCNQAAIAAYNAFSPTTAVGEGLSRVVKISGVSRNIATRSTVNLSITGVAGAVINNGSVGDTNGNRWDLPPAVVIPPAGVVVVTATARDAGNITASAGTVTEILTPTLGWQAATNPSVAITGAPVESDAALRQRQAISVALSSTTVLEGIVGAVSGIPGVKQVVAYENDTGAVDVNGLPAHSIALIVDGGSANQIAYAILVKKTPGAYTHGTTAIPVSDAFGLTNIIRFFVPTPVAIRVGITVQALAGYSSIVGDTIKANLVDYINNLRIGQNVDIPRLYLPAQLYGGLGSETFEVSSLLISEAPAPVAGANVDVAFNERATCLVADVLLTVV